jgi:hypothetical protein
MPDPAEQGKRRAAVRIGIEAIGSLAVRDCAMGDSEPEKRPIVKRWRWIGVAAAISELGVVGLAYRGDHTRIGDGPIDGRGVVITGFLLFVLPFAVVSLLALRSRMVSPWLVVAIAVGAGALFATARPGNLEALWFPTALFAAVFLELTSVAGRLVLLYAKRTR